MKEREEWETCPCGKRLGFKISPFMTPEQRRCPACGRLHYVDHDSIDWKRVGEDNETVDAFKSVQRDRRN